MVERVQSARNSSREDYDQTGETLAIVNFLPNGEEDEDPTLQRKYRNL